MSIAEGDRVYATELINYDGDRIGPGHEGTVERVTGSDAWPFIVEWDCGFVGAASESCVALVPALAR